MIEPRPEVLATEPAIHGGPLGSLDERLPVRLDFSASLNAWGPAPAVLHAVRSAPVDRYPDPQCLAPRRAAADRWGCAVDQVAFGAGAAELLQAICFAFVRPGDRVLTFEPTFGEYARASALCGARVVQLRGSGPFWAIDPARLVREVERVRPRLVFLCVPNNPTGSTLSRVQVAEAADACAAADALLVLDQSYDAFVASPLGTPAVPDHPAILSVRSITKDHALAGVRAAFAIGPAPTIFALERARVPWAASTLAQTAAVAALSPEGEAHLRSTLPLLRAERIRIGDAAARLGIRTVPSETHFVLLQVGNAAAMTERLRREHGIGVRDCTSFGLDAHIRVAARRPEENDALLEALGAVCSS